MSVVLLYHDVAPRGDFDSHGRTGPSADRYKLEPEQFDAHLEAIERAGRTLGLVGRGALPDVAISFDDGGRSSMAIADALERRGWRGHFFITTAVLGTAGFLDPDQVRELDRRGHVVGSHTHSHPDHMAQLADAEIELEWAQSRDVLADILHGPPTQASVPGGDVSPAVIGGAARAGYEVLMTSDPVRKLKRVDSLLVVGRFPIYASTKPRTAAAYAAEQWGARTQLALSWRAKRFAKRISPRGYDALRRLRGGV